MPKLCGCVCSSSHQHSCLLMRRDPNPCENGRSRMSSPVFPAMGLCTTASSAKACAVRHQQGPRHSAGAGWRGLRMARGGKARPIPSCTALAVTVDTNRSCPPPPVAVDPLLVLAPQTSFCGANGGSKFDRCATCVPKPRWRFDTNRVHSNTTVPNKAHIARGNSVKIGQIPEHVAFIVASAVARPRAE